ncbi:MAG TPA: hypothetical protein VH417_09785 [Vicinamibacterales bacterium]|jgi:hypothetical protein
MSNDQKDDRQSLDEIRRPTAAPDDPAVRVDELAADLDDLHTIADEIQDRPPAGANPDTVQRLKRALSDATSAADDIEDEIK